MNIQMILVLLALALFSTLLLNTYNIMLDQSTQVYDNILYLQGQKIADRYFQKIEAELLGNPPINYFSQIYYTYYNSGAGVDETMNINSVVYNINIISDYCDSLGANSSTDTLYQKVDIRINCLSTSLDTLYIGTLSSPFSKVFINRGF